MESGLGKLRTNLISTVMGKARSIRCLEVVVSECSDPLKMDPNSLVMATTLLNAKRLLTKSSARRADFIAGARKAAGANQQGKKVVLHTGPVKGVLDTCTRWARYTEVSKDDIIIYPHYGPPCRLVDSTKKTFKDFVRELARQGILKELAAEMSGNQPGRKDLAGFPDLVNIGATMAAAKLKEIPNGALSKTFWRQLHLSVVAGAIVTGDKLKKMGETLSNICPLDGCQHNVHHLFWECTAFDKLRRPFCRILLN